MTFNVDICHFLLKLITVWLEGYKVVVMNNENVMSMIDVSKGMEKHLWAWIITKTRLYNFDPLKPHFYTVKLGFTGVYIIFLILLENIDCGYALEPPRRGGSNEYPQSMFWTEIRKISEFLSENFQVFGGEVFYIFE